VLEAASAEQQVNEKCARLEEAIEQLQQQARASRGELEQATAQRRLAEARLAELVAGVAGLEQDLARQTQSRVRLRRQLSIAHHRVKAAATDAAARGRQRAHLERQLADTRARLESEQLELAKLHARMSAAETDAANATERLTRMELLLGEAMTARAQLEAQNLELTGTAKRLSEKLTLLHDQASLCRRIAELDADS
jgi:chromosome segregation ATPase